VNMMIRIVSGLALAFALSACDRGAPETPAPTESAAAPTAQARPLNIRGTVVALAGDQLTLTLREGGTATVTLPGDVRILGMAAASLDDIAAGDFIGSAGVPQADGTLLAQEVLIFPPPMAGTGEGHYPWDLTPESTMTNATVTSLVAQVDGRRLSVAYEGGEKTIVVPDGAPVVRPTPGDASLLVPGARIFAAVKPEGDGFVALRIVAEKDGVPPPM